MPSDRHCTGCVRVQPHRITIYTRRDMRLTKDEPYQPAAAWQCLACQRKAFKMRNHCNLSEQPYEWSRQHTTETAIRCH